ncbi:hypothetical protein [Corallococcus sp. AB049A]|uniref:hypothetical protein n=1 Tax=Corallococcus sp. AB049A TaxID=2316721 RepID=UPI0011C4A117|nr:hypothetical protein [Corallococcus sp. AB049A]
MTAQRRTWTLLGLLLAGLGAAHCRDPVDPPPVEGEKETPPLPAMAREARLLQVDAAQRVLLSIRADGTYAQDLPDGAPVRIADAAEGADITGDGQTTVMWSAEADGMRTVWLWRRGTPEAIVLSQKARGPVLHDGGQSFVAFLEQDGTGASAVRVARIPTCLPGDCVLQTLLQVQGGTPALRRGGTTLSLQNGAHRWLIDVPTGAVKDLGELPGHSFVSPAMTRYGWAEHDHVRLFDSATGAQVWEQVIEHADFQSWISTHAFMLSEERVYVGSEDIYMGTPQGVPKSHRTYACGAQGCSSSLGGDSCYPATLQGQLAMWCRPDPCLQIRCPQPSPSYRDSEGAWLYSESESGRVLGPILSQDLKNSVGLYGEQGQLHRLEWRREDEFWSLYLDAPYPSAPIQFLPDKSRVVFHQQVFEADGIARSHLWTWDRFRRVDLGRLDGAPGPMSIVRDNPPTFYLDTDVVNADGTAGTAIVRVAL